MISRNMRIKLLVLLVLTFFVHQSNSQIKLENIALVSEFSYGLRERNYITKAIGFGFSGELKFGISKSGWKFKIVFGYSDLKLEPSDSMTIERWGWDYWRIWYRNHVRTLIVDSNYVVDLNPKQRLYLLPAKLFIGKEFGGEKFKLFSGLGLGLTFYERAFWLNETWWKKFPNLPDSGGVYVFQYSFKNNAPSKKGTVLNLGLQVNGSYKISRFANVYFSLEFEHYPSVNELEKIEFGKITLGKVREADRNFVLRDVFKLSIGFSFNY